MTARTPSPRTRPTGVRSIEAAPARGVSAAWSAARFAAWFAALFALPLRSRCALGVAVAGGLLLAVGPLLPVVSPAMPPGFASGALLFVLGLLPVGVAVGLAGSASAMRGALLAAALFAPGRAVADAQLAVQGSLAARPELVMPTALVRLHGAAGLWLLLAGEVLVLAAGLLTIGTGEPTPTDRYRGPVLVALGVGVVAALGLIAVPFTSSTPFLLATDVLDAPPMALAGGLLIAVAAPLAATIAVTSAEWEASRGWLLGGGAVILAIGLPRIVAGLAVAGLRPSWGPYVAVLAAVALAAIGLTARRTVQVDGTNGTDGTADPTEADLQLPAQSRLHVATGVLGLIAAGAALVGADTSLYVLPADLPHGTDTASQSARLLIPAAVLIGCCAISMLVPRWATVVRPAFAVAWVTVPLAGFAAVDTALTATQIDGVQLGIGTWAAGLAMLAAVAGAATAGLAGGVERDDVDLTELTWRRVVLVPAAVGALLAIGAFGLPVVRAGGFTPPGLWSDFRFASWGLVCGVLAVLAAAALAPVCRPARAAALLLGAAGVVLVRLLSWPLNHAIAPGATAGPGLPLTVACLVALLGAAVLAGWPTLRSRR